MGVVLHEGNGHRELSAAEERLVISSARRSERYSRAGMDVEELTRNWELSMVGQRAFHKLPPGIRSVAWCSGGNVNLERLSEILRTLPLVRFEDLLAQADRHRRYFH